MRTIRNSPCSALRTSRSAFKFAFTRAELLVILAVLTLLALVVLPALANTRPRSARVICANNLRQIGMAMQLWGNDHGDRPPYEVELADGGVGLDGVAPGFEHEADGAVDQGTGADGDVAVEED